MKYTFLTLILLAIVGIIIKSESEPSTQAAEAPVKPRSSETQKEPYVIWFAARDLRFDTLEGAIMVPADARVEKLGEDKMRHQGRVFTIKPGDIYTSEQRKQRIKDGEARKIARAEEIAALEREILAVKSLLDEELATQQMNMKLGRSSIRSLSVPKYEKQLQDLQKQREALLAETR
jgi:hypothetical protein